MRRIMRLLAIAGTIGTAIWIDSGSRRARAAGRPLGEVLRADLRSFVTHRFDPLVMRLGLAGGQRSAWGKVEHVGRISATVYPTPVLPRITDDHAFIPLPSGSDVAWVRAAGHCRHQVHDEILELDEPAVVPARENDLIPVAIRGPLDRLGAH